MVIPNKKMIMLLMLLFSYVLLLFMLSLFFSINLCLMMFTSISENSECGFYSMITSVVKYRFNYWLIVFHFLMSEQELILCLLLLLGLHSKIIGLMVVLLSAMLFFDTLVLLIY